MACSRTCAFVALLGIVHPAHAQSPVPIITSYGRAVVFQDGVFLDLDPRKPQALFPCGDRLAFLTDAGDLKLFADGAITKLQNGEPVEVETSRHMLAWKTGPSLRIPKGDGAETLCPNVGRFTVSDSLIAYHDQLQQNLMVYWKGRKMPVADVLMSSEDVVWKSGPNTLLLYDLGRQRVLLFYRGQVSVLCDGDDTSRSEPGGDMVAYMDQYDDTFHIFDKGQVFDVDPFAPSSFKVGDGLVAYVTSAGAFRCFKDGRVWDIADFAPDDYWVRDSVLVFTEQGRFKTFAKGAVETIEQVVPEHWDVSGSAIAYLDVNGVLRLYRDGERIKVSSESGVKDFGLYPGAVSYVSNSGSSKVWWNGKLYEHY
jgi:hypothetical protein